MEEGKNHSAEQQRAILENIKEQALYNFQIGLNNEIKLLVRAQRHTSLQEAITGSSAEEKVKGPSAKQSYNRNKFDNNNPRRSNQDVGITCLKCGKRGHLGCDCRTSRYANKFSLPRAEGPPVNTVNKYCNYCKKAGHTRKECWSLNGRPRNEDKPQCETNKKYYSKNNEGQRSKYKAIKNSDTQSSEEDEPDDSRKKRTAADYRVTRAL
ncbi:hypothetical protein ALC57_02606 [Trachymyrmex cornetzi]|uniref:CCHC-type domain-containing protein n=1 Tax=Trachymyrmex cornetzi TaxID=471704 RepID=A0A151JNV7_9HYME|nr:hypothetical protein ALC57_02606 [Trachymyrmex cornetzi]